MPIIKSVHLINVQFWKYLNYSPLKKLWGEWAPAHLGNPNKCRMSSDMFAPLEANCSLLEQATKVTVLFRVLQIQELLGASR